MSARRGKSQARRNHGSSGGMPGWAWLVLGVVLTIVVVLAAPDVIKSGDGDGFFRPRPNPDAQPATSSGGDEAIVPEDSPRPAPEPVQASKPKYDFYTMLPGDEVAMSDAELAATAREEAAREAAARKAAETAQTPAGVATDAVDAAAAAASAAVPTAGDAVATEAAPRAPGDAPYILQAGAFGASGDAEATKAKVALLGLTARVESAQIKGRTVYRVRMGPYATASELAEAKRKLANGGLPAMAIKAK